MHATARTLQCFLVLCSLCPLAWADEPDLRTILVTEDIERVRISLNPWGPHLGFEIDVDGNHPGVAALTSVIQDAEPSRGHKCANRGAIRFWMSDGSVVAVGLLPSHTEGLYQFRLYEGSRLQAVFSVRRAALMAALAELGVPGDDPAFAEYD